nr:uncharacterized protein LOC107855189 [Ipomoea batatas]
MVGDSFLSKPPVFTGENYHAWSVKMKTYLEAHGLWEIMEIDEVPALPEDPTIAQMREYKRKRAWDLLKNEYEGNDRTKRMQVLNLKREFEMQKMKETESLKDYSERLKKVTKVDFFYEIDYHLLPDSPVKSTTIVRRRRQLLLSSHSNWSLGKLAEMFGRTGGAEAGVDDWRVASSRIVLYLQGSVEQKKWPFSSPGDSVEQTKSAA